MKLDSKSHFLSARLARFVFFPEKPLSGDRIKRVGQNVFLAPGEVPDPFRGGGEFRFQVIGRPACHGNGAALVAFQNLLRSSDRAGGGP